MKVVSGLQMLSVLPFLLCVSCKPSIGDCEECLTKKYDDAIRVIDITKKNGIGSVSSGYTIHNIYFSCTVEFIKDFELKSPMIGTFESFKKGDRFEIENAHARFVKTDNGWLCNGTDYDVLSGYYYIDADGNRIDADQYFRKQAEEKEQEPRCFTGSIDKYIPYAALKLRVIKSTLIASIYDKKTGNTYTCDGYVSGNKWVLKFNEDTWLEGDSPYGRFEGYYMQAGERLGSFSFREVSFDWEKTKKYDGY